MLRPLPIGAIVFLPTIFSFLNNRFRTPDDGSGDNLNGFPGDNASKTIAGISGASLSAPTCLLESTATVFITVYPSSPVTLSNGFPSDNHDPGQTDLQTVYPTQTIVLSPFESSFVPQSRVQPFTTLTIDIWGSEPGSSDNSGIVSSGSSVAAAYTNDAPTTDGVSGGLPDGDVMVTQTAWGNAATILTSTVSENAPDGRLPNSHGPMPGSGLTLSAASSSFGIIPHIVLLILTI